MHESNIVNNGEYAIYASSCNDPTNIIDATNNWWGLADSASIEPLVHHQVDDPASPIVDFVPFAVDSFDIEFTKPDYYCGDANSDGLVNIGDIVFLINYIFHSGSAPDPYDAGDANCDASVNIGDAIYLGNFIFQPGSPVPCADCQD